MPALSIPAHWVSRNCTLACFSEQRLGELLTTAVLREISRALGTACPVEFLPERIVARTAGLLVWWAPAAILPMFFREGSELAEVSGQRFPHPALLFAVSNGSLYIRGYAVELPAHG